MLFRSASEAIGINNGLDNGLQFKCNDYTNGKYDIYVYGNASTIAASQGSLSDPANNLFSNGGPILVSDLKNEGSYITYYHADPQSNSRVVPLYYTTNKVTLNYTGVPYDGNSCSTMLNRNAYSPGEINNIKQQINTTDVMLEQLVDQGNTADFESEIIFVNQESVYPVYIELLQTSPYLSKEILEKLGEQEFTFTNNLVRDVMIANPHSAKSDNVMGKLENRINPLPTYMMNQIRKGRKYTSSYENTLSEFVNLKGKLTGMAILNHKLLINQDSLDLSNNLINLYEQFQEPVFVAEKAKIWIYKGEFNQAMDLLNLAVNMADEKEKLYFEKIRDFNSSYIQWLIQGQKPDSLNNEAIAFLSSISNDHPLYKQAISLLAANGLVQYQEPLFLPSDDQLKTGFIMENEQDEMFELSIYPNPAIQQTTIMYDFSIYSVLSVEISDITGRIVYTKVLTMNCSAFVLDVSQFQPGQYFCSVLAGRSTLATKPLNIIR